jgi:hypothetical protein
VCLHKPVKEGLTLKTAYFEFVNYESVILYSTRQMLYYAAASVTKKKKDYSLDTRAVVSAGLVSPDVDVAAEQLVTLS